MGASKGLFSCKNKIKLSHFTKFHAFIWNVIGLVIGLSLILEDYSVYFDHSSYSIDFAYIAPSRNSLLAN